jgi:hypothetical protein
MIEEQQKTNDERHRALASSFAYVNPIVALLLGYAIAGESKSWLGLAGVVIILIGVVFIALGQANCSNPASIKSSNQPTIQPTETPCPQPQTQLRPD